jgi:hypothetical protein
LTFIIAAIDLDIIAAIYLDYTYKSSHFSLQKLTSTKSDIVLKGFKEVSCKFEVINDQLKSLNEKWQCSVSNWTKMDDVRTFPGGEAIANFLSKIDEDGLTFH